CGFRVLGPEIPLHRVVTQTGIWQTFLRTNEVWELHGVTHEEDRRVVPHEVEVALFGVELQSETTNVTPGVWGTELTGNGGEPCQHFGFDAGLEHRSFGVFRDVFGDGKFPECARAFRVWTALWDVHAVEVLQGFNQVGVVQDDGSVLANGQ